VGMPLWLTGGPGGEDAAMQHGYTNSTTRDGGLVRKTYQGPDALHRAKSERLALRLLAGRIPVPVVVDGGDTTSLTMQFVEGEHGQELIDAGKAEHVLRACGGVLARLHAIDVSTVYPGTHAKGLVIRHGDFGPNNVLLSSETLEITAVLDWEFSGPGQAIEDLAWCEWIVRMHHPDVVAAVGVLYDAYGWEPTWSQRHETMIARCLWLQDFSRRWDPAGAGVRQWRDRVAVTAGWTNDQ